MAEMNLNQIIDKLNTEFTGDVRKLVFWYDANAEFAEDIDSIELENAKVLHLEKDNQFFIKYFLECEDTETNYLVYAPFAKPDIRENHLADTIRYSKEFFADRASLLTLDLGIDERYKPVIQHYIKFFANKDRTQKFYDLEIEIFNRSTIEVALMCVLCKSKTASFEEVLRCVLTNDDLVDNKYLAEFEKYNLMSAFWQQVDIAFGFNVSKPTLEKLVMSLFITYASKVIHADLPTGWLNFISYKTGNVIAFIDNLMNSVLYSESFDELSGIVYNTLNAEEYLSKMDVEALLDCNIFSGIDNFILGWLISRLENEDIGATLSGKSILEICDERRKKHFGKLFTRDYYVIENAYNVIANGKFQNISGIEKLAKEYMSMLYKVDSSYRYFYYYIDLIEETSKYEKLKELVENLYTNKYLNKITVNWNRAFEDSDGVIGLPKQTDFFLKYVKNAKERTVVIISDALRYEVASSLNDKFKDDEKCKSTLSAMQGVLPSYTPLGMASLLPHRKIEYTDYYEILVDDKKCVTTEQRDTILKNYIPNSVCIQFDSLKSMKQAELRSVFTGQDVVYVYHNQIDARGDAAKTENEVFTACEEAISEIHAMTRRISSQANTHHFVITADHGFIYKRDKISASDKIGGLSAKSNSVGQRYYISNDDLNVEGVCKTTLGKVLGSDDSRTVAYPLASDIFKVSGAGQNYVHGGCSPQEMLVPVIDVKVERGKKETTNAQISLVSLTNKITNLITTLDFVQTEPVSDKIKEATYRIYFVSSTNEKISNENICNADKKDKDTTKRMFRFRFNFKNKKYDKSQKYYLVAYDDMNDVEVLRHEIIMDIAFADDFGFFG